MSHITDDAAGHNTARAATVTIAGGQRLGAVLMYTLPGVPVVFAGDEFGLAGHNEASRTPMPWPLCGKQQEALCSSSSPGPPRTLTWRREH